MTFDFLTSPMDETLIKERYFDDGKIKADRIAQDIVASLHIITMFDSDEIMYYKDGIYHGNGEKIVIQSLITRLGPYIKKYHIGEVVVQVRGRTYTDRSELNNRTDIVHLNNGMYNIQTGEFMDFDPAVRSTNKIPVDYDPSAECPAVEKFISEIMSEQDMVIIYELFGYCLYHGYPFQYMFMFKGNGANGKSVLINLFKAFIGRPNCAAISLQDISNDRFAGSELYGKMLNLYPDISDEALKTTGTLKALTGGDGIDVQRKFQDRFHLDNHAKLVFSCNTLPYSKDITDAFFRRWYIIEFPHKFSGDKADKFLIDKLTVSSELSGLLNKSLAQLSTLLDRGDFSYSKSTEVTKERYMRLSNSMRAFVMDCIDIDVMSTITKEDFYNAYTDYCRDQEIMPKAKKNVGDALRSMMSVGEKKVSTEDGRKEAWRGIRFNADNKYGSSPVIEPEPSIGGLDEFTDDEDALSLGDRVGIVLDALTEGMTEKELIDKIGDMMTMSEVKGVVRHLVDRGDASMIGGIIEAV